MKCCKFKSLLLIALLICGSLVHVSKAQVTIGSGIPPVQGALLEIKSEEQPAADISLVTDRNNITSKQGGLGLPRVMLENRTTLEPFIDAADAGWVSNTDKIREKHAGLVVYNIRNNDDDNTITDPDLRFKQGIYVWNGAFWKNMDEGPEQRFFYAPSFNLMLEEVTPPGNSLSCDLYAEYAKQFTKNGVAGSPNLTFVSSNPSLQRVPSPSGSKLYLRNELDYVVTYYDPSVINITNIDSEGIITYEVKSLATSPASFINIVFIVK